MVASQVFWLGALAGALGEGGLGWEGFGALLLFATTAAQVAGCFGVCAFPFADPFPNPLFDSPGTPLRIPLLDVGSLPFPTPFTLPGRRAFGLL